MKALIFVGGDLGDVTVHDLPKADFVIAADSGLHHARALNVNVDVVIGDMDSVDESLIGNTHTVRFPIDKDATDTELAIEYAIDRHADEIVLVGGVGGRLDHSLGILMGLAQAKWAHIMLSAIIDNARIYVVRDSIEINGKPGETISTFAVAGDVTGLNMDGLKWSGHYERLEVGSSLGLSNELSQPRAQLSVKGGTLLVIHLLNERNH